MFITQHRVYGALAAHAAGAGRAGACGAVLAGVLQPVGQEHDDDGDPTPAKVNKIRRPSSVRSDGWGHIRSDQDGPGHRCGVPGVVTALIEASPARTRGRRSPQVRSCCRWPAGTSGGHCGTHYRPGDALLGDEGGLLQAGLHGNDGGDGHPVGAGQLQPEGDRDSGRQAAAARITAKRISGRVSGLGEISPGISATGCDCVPRPRTSHMMKV